VAPNLGYWLQATIAAWRSGGIYSMLPGIKAYLLSIAD